MVVGETVGWVGSLEELYRSERTWSDLDLGHRGFRDTKQGLRYMISEPPHPKVLDSLLPHNHDRYAEEVAQGLHDKGRKAKKGARPTKKTQASEAESQRLLF